MSRMTLAHEFTMRIQVAPTRPVGTGPAGFRGVAEVLGGTVTGPRLNGAIVAPGADWVLVGADGWARLDVRLQIATSDALIYVTYDGLLERNAKVSAALADPSAETTWGDQYFRTAPRFECGAPGYEWLRTSLFVARGRIVADGVEYEVSRVS